MNALDRVFMERAYDLAARGIGNTSPNPPVGAVVVAGGEIVGEGYHHRAGEAHAEVLALAQAGERARGATLYVTLEPCNHHGRTPPCSHAVARSGVGRVVAGTSDPNPRTAAGGIEFLTQHAIAVEVADDDRARALIEPFARAIRAERPFVSLKMAMSLDGYVAPQHGVVHRLTGEESREFVRELRIAHDAVLVGAGTVRVDNPQLTVRPPHHRLRDYVRVVACETAPVPSGCTVFAAVEGYARTIVLAPAALEKRFEPLSGVADVIFVESTAGGSLDLAAGLRALKQRGIESVLCEGGPTLAGTLLAQKCADRFYWLVAPVLLYGEHAVPVLRGAAADERGLCFERVEPMGADMLISGTFRV